MQNIEANKIAAEVVKILKGELDLDKKILTPFKKTERLLSELSFLKGAIEIKEKMITDLKNGATIRRKKEIGMNIKNNKTYLSEIEKKENRIEQLQGEIDRIKSLVSSIEISLETIKNDKYYKIIELKYFQDKTLDKIAEELDVALATVKRNKNKLIRKLQLLIFSDEVIKNILE